MCVPTDKTPCRDERGGAFAPAKDGVLRGTSKCCNFTSDFRKNGHFPRADRVVRPYGAKWKINTDLPENRHKIGAFGGSVWASTPTAWNHNSTDAPENRHKIDAFGGSMWASTPTARNGKRGDFSLDALFSIPFVWADDSVRPYGAKSKSNTDSPENCHKAGVPGGRTRMQKPGQKKDSHFPKAVVY